MLAASGSGDCLCRWRRLSSRLTAGCHNVITLATDWTLALFWSTCHSALPATLTEGMGHFMNPRNETESKLIISLFQPAPGHTTAHRSSSSSNSPWLSLACGKGTNIWVVELYGLLTLKDFVNSARCHYGILMQFDFTQPPALVTIGKAETLLALEKEWRRIKSLGILSFFQTIELQPFSSSLCCRYSLVTTSIVL